MKRSALSILSTIVLLWAVAGMMAVSCTREIILDSGDKPAVVVECVLSNDSIQELKLSLARTASRNDGATITNPSVLLLDKTTGEQAGYFIMKNDSTWSLDYSALPGHRYGLEVHVDGYDPIVSETEMPKYRPVKYVYDDGDMNDPSDDCIVYLVSSLPNHSIICFLNQSMSDLTDEIVTDLAGVDNANLSGKAYNGISYHYLPSMASNALIDYHEFPWVRYVYLSVPELIGKSIHKQYLLVDKNRCGGQDRFRLYTSDAGNLRISSCSDDYWRYLMDAAGYKEKHGQNNFANIYANDNIYSNITGGVGIFGATTNEFLPYRISTKRIDTEYLKELPEGAKIYNTYE